MTVRNPLRGQVALVGVGQTEYGRNLGRTELSLGLEAARMAIVDAGLTKNDIDGICGTGAGFAFPYGANMLSLQEALGIPQVTWPVNGALGAAVVYAAHAVAGGACETAVVVQAYNRSVGMSRSARNDPFRLRSAQFGLQEGAGQLGQLPGHYEERYGVSAYCGLMQRYLHDHELSREVMGYLAVNNRTNAGLNEHAVMRTPITMDDYFNARMIRDPLGLLDMDLPVDGANAFVITTSERARDLKRKPVFFEAATFGQSGFGIHRYENVRAWNKTAPWYAMAALWQRTDYHVEDMDLFFPYDGYTPNAVNFTEAAGWCGEGEALDFFKQNWMPAENRLKIHGRTLFSSNGGSLSDGRTGGCNYYHEAVLQLRGDAGARQVPDAKTALLGIGSFFHDPVAVILRTD
jgi:acetyl-CoA acetyltransferase